jgi:uncharacterized membrane protein
MKWPFHFTAWQRQGLALLPAALASVLSAAWMPEPQAAVWLLGWITYCATYVALVWHLAARLDAATTQQLAQREDPGAAMLFVFVTAAAWLLIQCVFTLHYARVYYREGNEAGSIDRGLAFPDGRDPDYLDLLYHSMVVGMTSQVSDVSVRSRPMRHLVLVHALLSFAFNLGVLATAVNVLASAGR